MRNVQRSRLDKTGAAEPDPGRRPSPCRAAAAAAMLLVACSGIASAEMLQPGFHYHEPSTITLSNAGSGTICADESGALDLCERAARVVIEGEATCEYSGNEYPCTRFGYEFDYSDATPGTELECDRMRYDPKSGEQNDSYTRAIEAESGRIAFLTFRTFAPVEERLIFSEVHHCSYRGERVATIEFIIHYEPGAGGAGEDAAPRFPEVPNACSDPYLTEDTAESLLRASAVRRHAATEHIPVLQSQCIYGAAAGGSGQVGYVFKFMLSDMFDVDRLSTQQVDFNATFANGGAAPEEILTEPGRRAYIFRKGDRATLFVITGIKGRDDFAGRENEFVALYYIDKADLDFAAKQGLLLEQARLHMRHWTQ